MYLETILIASIIGIFVVIARRLPESFRVENLPKNPAIPSNIISTSVSTTSQPKVRSNLFKKLFSKLSFSLKKTTTLPITTGNPMIFNRPIAMSNGLANKKESIVTETDLLKEGDRYLDEGKLKEAERSYLRAVAKNPSNPKLYNRLGVVYLKQRNFRDTLEAFEAACNLDPTKSARHYNVALAAWELKNLPKARTAISQAISLEPDSTKYQQLKELIEQV